MSRTDSDIEKAIKKACSSDEAAPKRKHVRTLIVYTFDNKSAKSVFAGFQNFYSFSTMKADFDVDVKIFKMLIVIHKVLQEGHKSAISEGIRNMEWINSLGSKFSNPGTSYGSLINGYVNFILAKLKFHRNNKGFSGTFEYEEYISLRAVDDPNEGYEAILDLLDLQRKLFKYSRIVFKNISLSEKTNECKISSLVPLVSESYGIYKFVTSMLRGMFKQSGDTEALYPLVESFEKQHQGLFKFYSNCSSISFLSSLITIPMLPVDPPNVTGSDEQRPSSSSSKRISLEPEQTVPAAKSVSPPVPPPAPIESSNSFLNAQPTGISYWQTQQIEYQREQEMLEQQRQAQILEQQRQQELFQQQQQAIQYQQEHQMQLLQQQQTGAINSLQNDVLTLRSQYDQDQTLLQQYDQRVQQLEAEIENINNNASLQIQSKDGQITALSEESKTWKSKYESLSKLYSQLRQEHLNLLTKFKKLQQRAASASEAVEKKEKLERDLKAKNIELADLIRERDRARLDNDKILGQKESTTDKLELEIRELKRKLKEQEQLHSGNLTKIFQQHQQEVENYKKSSETPTLEVTAEIQDLRAQLQDKTEELEIVQQTMEETIQQLASQQKDNDSALDEQIDEVLKDHLDTLINIVDAILQGGIASIQDLLFELSNFDFYVSTSSDLKLTTSSIFAAIEKSEDQATNFATAFSDFLADGPTGDYGLLILNISQLGNALASLSKSCFIVASDAAVSNEQSKELLSLLGRSLREAEYFLEDLQHENLEEEATNVEEKQNLVISGNVDLHEKLEDLADFIDGLNVNAAVISESEDLATAVGKELDDTEKAIIEASSFIPNLLSSVDFSGELGQINKTILEFALEIIQAVLQLTKASIASQHEVASNNDMKLSQADFYRKNSRWTEGLISAAKAVGNSTKLMIGTADGLLKGSNSYEEFIVASKDVSASTAQLVAASRTKLNIQSKTQMNLEDSSRLVSNSCKNLVEHIKAMLAKTSKVDEIDISKLSIHEHKTLEMEQQVEILKLEMMLDHARKRLGDIRQFNYKSEEQEGIVNS
ncbi:Sla2 protein [Hanseniaspora uvarum]|nr:Sla2 protein [Hanseniaspora uvarum]